MKIFSKKQDEGFILEEPTSVFPTPAKADKPQPSHLLTADEVLANASASAVRYDGKSALESLKKRMQQSFEPNEAEEPKEQKPVKVEPAPQEEPKVIEHKSLLEKCKPFITDNNGKSEVVATAPIYKLESVADILERDSQSTISRLAKQYNITVDDLGKAKKAAEASVEHAKPEEPETELDKEVIEINAFFENVQSSVPFAVSETETQIATTNTPKAEFTDGSTITFTPVADNGNQKATVVVSGNTQSIDLTGEFNPVQEIQSFSKPEQVTLEKNEFEDFTPENEIRDEVDIKRYVRKFSLAKRASFLVVSFSIILTAILASMKLPFMTGLILGKTQTMMIICTAITTVIALLNVDIFSKLPKIFSKKSVADSSCSVAVLCTLAYAVIGILENEIVLDMLLLLGVILSLRALGKFRKDSYTLSNLKQMSAPDSKTALKLIDDAAVTFAMAKSSVDGDTLIAAPQKCGHIADFIKYSSFGTFLNGKLSVISVVSVVLSILTGLAAANYYESTFYGLYAAAAIQCFTSLPILFFIKDFPLYSAAKKLNKKGAMIAGQMGANHIEMANALVLNSADIFPSGTVTLHQMKVLSENNLDQTVLSAASLTAALNSPLAPIFKKIAGESNIETLPDSDTIKYEERMGISGWVNNKLLFIGNRTLMEAHGIQVPDIEIDRKILRNGYFPVYVASADKVCALLVVQYSVNPDVAYELRRLTKIGVTLLVNNTDPNVSSEMICDYLGLYDDAVMIMTNAGYHMYKNSITEKEACSAPASFRRGNITIASIMNCANKIRRSNTLLTVLYVISAILGIIIFAYSSFAGSGTLIGSTTVLLYSLICTVFSYLLYLILKP